MAARRCHAEGRTMKNLEALIDHGGSFGIGPVGSIECTATAEDGHNAMAMLVRRDGETLNAPFSEQRPRNPHGHDTTA